MNEGAGKPRILSACQSPSAATPSFRVLLAAQLIALVLFPVMDNTGAAGCSMPQSGRSWSHWRCGWSTAARP
jgi:hypothetical protein